MIKRSLGGAASSTIVLDTLVEDSKHSYVHFSWFTGSKSPLPIDGKMMRKASILKGGRLGSG